MKLDEFIGSLQAYEMTIATQHNKGVAFQMNVDVDSKELRDGNELVLIAKNMN